MDGVVIISDLRTVSLLDAAAATALRSIRTLRFREGLELHVTSICTLLCLLVPVRLVLLCPAGHHPSAYGAPARRCPLRQARCWLVAATLLLLLHYMCIGVFSSNVPQREAI